MSSPTENGLSDDKSAFRSGFSERLRWVLDRFENRAEAAVVAGVGANQLSRYLRGVDPSWEVVAKLAANRGVSLDWLLNGEGPRLRDGSASAFEDEPRKFRHQPVRDIGGIVSIPLFDVCASAGGGNLVWDEQPETRIVFPRAMLRRLGISPIGAKLMKASGDSMYPTIADENLMLVDSNDLDPRDDVFVLRRADTIHVKRLQRRTDGSLLLRSDNPAYDDERLPRDEAEELQLIARVRQAFRSV